MRERISKAAGDIDRLSARRLEARHARDFHERAEALRKPAERLMGLLKSYRLLRRHDVNVPVKAGTARALLGHVTEIQQFFVENAESILKPDPKRSAVFWKPLEMYGDQVESDLHQGWKNWVSDTLPGGEQELLGVLDKFPSFRGPVQAIRTGVAEAAQLSAQVPLSDAPFEVVERLAETMEQAWARLNGAQVSPAVLTFLKRAAAREATLADYTPDVMKWVHENDLFRSFLITLGGK